MEKNCHSTAEWLIIVVCVCVCVRAAVTTAKMRKLLPYVHTLCSHRVIRNY